MFCEIWYRLYNLKDVNGGKNRAWRSVTLVKLLDILKVTLLHMCFSCFLNCTNGTKSRKASHIGLKGEQHLEGFA